MNIYSSLVAAYLSQKPTVIEGVSVPVPSEFETLETLLERWPSSIEAHLPDLRDEMSAIETTPKDAHKLFQNGLGLLFKEVNKFSAPLQQWLEEFQRELGLSALTYGRCLIYVTPDGKGTAPHFDQNINFVYQVSGTKLWTMSENVDVQHPLTRHTMGQEADPELQSYLQGPLPGMMTSCQTFELKPGSILFVPRGHWHETEAHGEALSLNFTFTAPSWLDLMTAALRGRLALDPSWRETARGLTTPEDRAGAEQRFSMLLQELSQDLPHWSARDILGATDPF